MLYKCNTFQVISDLVLEYINLNVSKIHKKIIKKDPDLILPQGNLLVA